MLGSAYFQLEGYRPNFCQRIKKLVGLTLADSNTHQAVLSISSLQQEKRKK